MEGHRLKRQDRFARFVHRLNLLFESLRRGQSAQTPIRIDHHPDAAGDGRPTDSGDEGALVRFVADADLGRFACAPGVADVDIVLPGGKIDSS